MGFLEMQDVRNGGFPCRIRKSELSMFTFCHASLRCCISRGVGQGVQGAVSCRVGMCWGDLQLALPRPELLLLLSDGAPWLQCGCHHILIVCLFCWKCFDTDIAGKCVLAKVIAELGCTSVSSFQKPAKSSSKLTALFESPQKWG